MAAPSPTPLSPAALRVVAAAAALAGSAAAGLAYAGRHSAPLGAGLPRRVVLPPELANMAAGLAVSLGPGRNAAGELAVAAPAAPPVPEDPACRLPLWLASVAGLAAVAVGGAAAYAALIARAGAPGVAPGGAAGLGLAAASVAVASAAAAAPLARRAGRGPLPARWEAVEFERAVGRRAAYAREVEKYRALVAGAEGLAADPAYSAARVGDELRVHRRTARPGRILTWRPRDVTP